MSNPTRQQSPTSTTPSTPSPEHRPAGDRDCGQATTEYALVLLAAALVGVLVIGWATAGGGAAAIGRLFDAAINAVLDQF